jgi:hypothetical protein
MHPTQAKTIRELNDSCSFDHAVRPTQHHFW